MSYLKILLVAVTDWSIFSVKIPNFIKLLISKIVTSLGNEKGCNYVVALTHMRNVNDKRYAKASIGVDLILGGHDHIYWIEQRWDNLLLKSGSNYRCLSEIKIEQQNDHHYVKKTKKSNGEVTDETVETDKIYTYLTPNLNQDESHGQYKIQICKRDITAEVPPIPELEELVRSYDGKLNEEMKVIICKSMKSINVNFSHIRKQESLVGNFLAGLMRKETLADVAILNSGGMRADQSYQPGYMTLGDWTEIFPFRQVVMKVEVSGEQLHMLLESIVAKYPALEGRWPSISNIKFTMDAREQPGHRIKKEDIFIDGGLLNYPQKYSLACMRYCADGNDGYYVLNDAKILVERDAAPFMNDIITKVFSLPKNPDFQKEFHLYKERRSDINDELISVIVKQKLKMNDGMFDLLEDVGIDEAETMSDSSSSSDEELNNQDEIDCPLTLLKQLSLKRKQSIEKGEISSFQCTKNLIMKKQISNETAYSSEKHTAELLTADNIEKVIKDEVHLSKDCCLRLRYYKLFEDVLDCPESNSKIFQWNPKLDGRIKIIGYQTT